MHTGIASRSTMPVRIATARTQAGSSGRSTTTVSLCTTVSSRSRSSSSTSSTTSSSMATSWTSSTSSSSVSASEISSVAMPASRSVSSSKTSSSPAPPRSTTSPPDSSERRFSTSLRRSFMVSPSRKARISPSETRRRSSSSFRRSSRRASSKLKNSFSATGSLQGWDVELRAPRGIDRGPALRSVLLDRHLGRPGGRRAGQETLLLEHLAQLLVGVVGLVVQAVEQQIEVDAPRADQLEAPRRARAAARLVDRQPVVDRVDQVQDRRAGHVDARHRDHAVVGVGGRAAGRERQGLGRALARRPALVAALAAALVAALLGRPGEADRREGDTGCKEPAARRGEGGSLHGSRVRAGYPSAGSRLRKTRALPLFRGDLAP